uniref:N/A n=1 Tax=Ganoderma boninense TaxID=34458 RepID=A0A5K1K0R3_9APHY|nr:N/A [Ganoderma boninense]
MFLFLFSWSIVLLTGQALAAANLIPLQKHAGTEDLFPMPDCSGFKLHEATIDEMQTAMRQGKLTSVQLVMCYLARTYQTQEYINSVLQHNPDLFAIAAERDAERRQGNLRGPLHGIPFTVKDNIGSKDSLETTAGSWALLGNIVPRDAHVVKRLREAGAVLFGKAGLSEWADMRSNDYSEGYSARGGQVRSAYNLTVNPGGSSSGGGVGVAANAIAFSLGTETDGSVINPASRNALVGIKPTVGLTSRAGVIPESEHQDSVGILARTVRDATLVLDAIYGVDERDNYTLAQAGKTPAGGYAQFLANKTALQGAVFGLPWKSFWVYADEDQQTQLLDLVDLVRSAGATILNNTEITDYQTLVSPDGWNWDWGTVRGFPNESEYTYIKVDFYNNIKSYLAEVSNTNVRSLEDIVQYNLDNAGSEGGVPGAHPAFASGQDGFLASLATRGVRDETYWQALDFCQSKCRQGIDDALTHNRNGTRMKLAGLLVPPQVAQAPQIAAQAGYPVIAIPAGVDPESGMPFGLGIMQTAWGEGELVRWASAIEDLQRSVGYKRPLPTWRGYLQRNLPVPF